MDKKPSRFSSLFFKRLKKNDNSNGNSSSGEESRTWRRRKSKISTGFRWKRKFNLFHWIFDSVLFKIVSFFEAIVLVSKLCFFYLCCGCHF